MRGPRDLVVRKVAVCRGGASKLGLIRCSVMEGDSNEMSDPGLAPRLLKRVEHLTPENKHLFLSGEQTLNYVKTIAASPIYFQRFVN